MKLSPLLFLLLCDISLPPAHAQVPAPAAAPAPSASTPSASAPASAAPVTAPPPAPPALAAPTPPTAAAAPIPLDVPLGLAYGTMRRALQAFQQEHALAPEAEARFELRPQTAAANLAGLRLELARDADARTYLPVMADATFSLPDNARDPGASAILVLNRPAAQWRWRPSVRSPDVPPNARRLGDLRLECRMLWAMQADPSMAAAGGPCLQNGVTTALPAPRPLAAATLTAGQQRLALPLGPGGASYAAPLADPAWPDTALVHFDFATP